MFKTVNGGKLPTKGSKFAAAVDLYANEDVVIGAGETKLVGLGVCIDLENSNIYKTSDYRWAERKEPDNETLEIIKQQAIRDFMRENCLELHPRSSLRAKGLISGVGVIDLDFEQEIKIIIHNPICGVYQDFQDDFHKEFKLLETHTYNAANNEVRYTIKKGDKIAQILLKEHKSYLLGVESDEERSGGFGSTGE